MAPTTVPAGDSGRRQPQVQGVIPVTGVRQGHHVLRPYFRDHPGEPVPEERTSGLYGATGD